MIATERQLSSGTLTREAPRSSWQGLIGALMQGRVSTELVLRTQFLIALSSPGRWRPTQDLDMLRQLTRSTMVLHQ